MQPSAVSGRNLVAAAADWMEISAIANSRFRCSGKDLARTLSPLAEEFEEPDQDELLGLADVEESMLNRRDEEWLGDVLEEIQFRADALRECYPFKVVRVANDWWIEWQKSDAVPQVLYEVCLVITAARDGIISPQPDRLDGILQLAAYLTAGSLIKGESHWMGFPRPDGTGFKASLETCLKRMGYRNVELRPPPWTYRNDQDAGIDIISWKGFADQLPGRLVVFGQVASGRNQWKDKSVKPFLDADIGPWLGVFRPGTLIEAMFVPWPLYSEVNHVERLRRTGEHKSFRDWAHDEGLHLEKKLGIIVDRERLVELASRGISTGLDDEPTHLATLRNWHSAALALLTE